MQVNISTLYPKFYSMQINIPTLCVQNFILMQINIPALCVPNLILMHRSIPTLCVPNFILMHRNILSVSQTLIIIHIIILNVPKILFYCREFYTYSLCPKTAAAVLGRVILLWTWSGPLYCDRCWDDGVDLNKNKDALLL